MSKPNGDNSKGRYHRMIFMGQNIKDNELVKEAIERITEFGYDRWLIDDTKTI
jgi:hypothetical protein